MALLRNSVKPMHLVILPVIGWLIWFLLIPLGIVIVYSFLERGPYGGVVWRLSFNNYARISDPVYLSIFINSIKLATATTLTCLILGYPMAFVMATAGPAMRFLLLVLVMLPFLTNFVIRAYAFKILLGIEGPIMSSLLAIGVLNEPFPLTHSTLAVWLGMVTNYLPFMVLPLFVTIDRFDFTLLEAARDLGARSWHIFRRVFFPLTLAGVRSGCVLVFMPALGEFVIPDILGGAKTMLLGNLITEQFLKSRDWPFGAALAIVLMVGVSVFLTLEKYLEPKGKQSP